MQNKIFKWIVIAVILFGLFVLAHIVFDRFKKSNIIEDNIKQKTELLKINDSLEIVKQLLKIEENRDKLTSDKTVLEAVKKAKLKPESIAQWVQVYSGEQRNIKLEDSLNRKVEAFLALQNKLIISSEIDKRKLKLQYDKEKADLLNIRISFSDSTKYRILQGDIGLSGNIKITKDSITSEPFVVFGERKRFLGIGKPEYSVVVGNKNPLLTTKNMVSSKYIPNRKVEFSVGAVLMTDGKDFVFGPSINFKKGFFSFTGGYTLINTK